jgi:hypothetical protein
MHGSGVLCAAAVVAAPQLRQQLAAAQASACASEVEACTQHQAQLDGMSAGHAARVQQLQLELASDAARRAELEDRVQVGL